MGFCSLVGAPLIMFDVVCTVLTTLYKCCGSTPGGSSDDDASPSSCDSGVHDFKPADSLSSESDGNHVVITVHAAPPVVCMEEGRLVPLSQRKCLDSLQLSEAGQCKKHRPVTKQTQQRPDPATFQTSAGSSPNSFPDCGSIFSMLTMEPQAAAPPFFHLAMSTKVPQQLLPDDLDIGSKFSVLNKAPPAESPPFLPQALDFGVCSEVGSRVRNEDMVFGVRLHPSADHAIPGSFSQAICCGLFDGHGGDEVSAYFNESLPKLVSEHSYDIKKQGAGEVADMLLRLEQEITVSNREVWRALDRDPGSTALVTTIMDNLMLVANVGDCRLLLVSEACDSTGNRTTFVSKSTSDHNCARNPDEAQRVHLAGGVVDSEGYIGSLLEVSRSLGDFETKRDLGLGIIISDAELFTWTLGPQELMAIAVSDGITGVMDDMEICNMVCTLLNDKKHLNDSAYAARELANYAVSVKESTDNCSAIVMLFKESPPPSPARRRLFGRSS